MARFQAQTNAVLDAQLEELRDLLGLRTGEKAELLREAADLASWVVRQTKAGRRVEARRGREVRVLEHPSLERLLHEQDETVPRVRVALNEEEVACLAKVLRRGFSPTHALRKSLAALANTTRQGPTIRWRDKG